MTDRIRVLLVAESANPEWVSVPLVGWSHSRAIAERTSALVATQVRNRDAALRAGLVEGRDFVAIDSERLARPLWRATRFLRGGAGKGWTTVTALSALSYYYFEHVLWRELGARIRAGEFDLVHRLTPLSPTTPSLLAARCRRAGVPFVLGPLNGGVPWPAGFNRERVAEREWLSFVRGLHRFMPGARSTFRDASAIIVGSRDTMALTARRHRPKCVYIVENGIDPARFPDPGARRPAVRPVRALFLGRLVPYKGCDMVIEAAAPLLRDGAMTLEVVGDGPQRAALEALVKRERVESGVQFRGWIKHTDVHERFMQADLFTFPSIREFGGGAALEAMAMGAVPVIVGYGGPAELVTERTGFVVPIGGREEIVEGLRRTLTEACGDPSLIEARRPAAVRRARVQFSWSAKADQTLRVYEWALGRGPKPEFAAPTPDLATCPAPKTCEAIAG